MSIFFIGSEPEVFDGFTGAATTSASVAISGQNRAGIILSGNAQTAVATFSSALTEGWLHFICARGSTNLAGTGVNTVFLLRNAEGQAVVTFTGRAADSFFTASILGGTGVAIPSGSRVDIQWKIAASGGYIRIWANEVLAVSFSGDTRFASGTQSVANCYMAGITNTITYNTLWSQFLVSDLPTLGAKVYTNPLTVAAVNEWSGTPTNVTGTDLSGITNAIKETTPDQKILFNSDDLSALGSNEFIGGVGFSASALAELGTAVPKLGAVAFNGTTETAIGTSQTKTTTFSKTNFIANVNPVTGLDWSVTTFNGMQFGLVAKA